MDTREHVNGDHTMSISPGTTAIVTGASSGIGYAVAEALLAHGANIVANGRNETKLHEAAERLNAPDRLAVVVGDVADPETGRRLAATATGTFDRLDLLVNNAGHFDVKPLADYTPEDLDGYFGFLRGAYFATQAAVAAMRPRKAGTVINITTNLTRRAIGSVPSSGPIAAKGGIEALTYNLAMELAPENIRVNAVAPGIVRTPLINASEDQWRSLAALHPLGREGAVSDIADAVLYLAGATWVTGVVLPVDGGLRAGAA
jgi:NAD(P)-dependent dehydrogenase (short-subunit alcohol dehydrogenase family)